MLGGQLPLFGHEEPACDRSFARLSRRALGAGAWIDYAPGWVSGHAALFEQLARTVAWRSMQERIYDRVVEAPRLFAAMLADAPGHPLLESMQTAFALRYGERFPRISMALYRDGRDGVAWHGDRIARRMDTALVATVSLGTPRRFLLRPHGGGDSIALTLGFGDLLVMGGTCQRTYQHCIPKVARAEPRIAIMFRPDWAANYDVHRATADG